MIYGVGTDIVSIPRIASILEKSGDRFAEKILGTQELSCYRERKAQSETRGLRYLATRFAAKEAFSKAIGTGIRSPMSWRLMQTLNSASGKPEITVNGTLREWMSVQGLTSSVSISDESEYAVAFVVVEKTINSAD